MYTRPPKRYNLYLSVTLRQCFFVIARYKIECPVKTDLLLSTTHETQHSLILGTVLVVLSHDTNILYLLHHIHGI